MKAEIYWMTGVPKSRLAVLPRPRGGDWLEDEIKSLRLAGVDVLVSLLIREEADELDLAEESKCCAVGGIEFISFPITDRSVPVSTRPVVELVRRLTTVLIEGKSVAIHCRQGIGRAGLLAACLLASLGDTADAAFGRIVQARGCSVPDTPEQREWVVKFSGRCSPEERH